MGGGRSGSFAVPVTEKGDIMAKKARPIPKGYSSVTPSLTQDNAVQTIDIIGCLECVIGFKTDCLDRVTVPKLGGYPPECN